MDTIFQGNSAEELADNQSRARQRAFSLLFAGTISAGAFLLFQVQPIVAKTILPWFGGTSAVWIVCLLFFQTTLLLGYLYAHLSVRILAPRWQAAVHTILLACSLLCLPVTPTNGSAPTGTGNPAFRILAVLGVSIGLPYFLLSATSPLLQAWYVRSHAKVPYRFFALSNLFSLAALMSYPIAVEPFWDLRHQAEAWSVGYSLFVVLCVLVAWFRGRRAVTGHPEPGAGQNPAPKWTRRLLWLLLACCPSVLLLATTNHLCQDVAPVPFLWILPLSLYLLSFIICFDSERWYQPSQWRWLLAAVLSAMAFVFLQYGQSHLRVQLAVFAIGLFVCCMFCHGELARRKPDPAHLTGYYLVISLGGALGAVMVSLIAPLVFTAYHELPVGLAACSLLGLFLGLRKSLVADLVWAAVAPILLMVLLLPIRSHPSGTRFAARNFYGAVRVGDSEAGNPKGPVRKLIHGSIQHGTQSLSPARRREPTAYYGPESGIGLALDSLRRPALRVGIIGLGAGTIAAYGRAGDVYRFYEINPAVVDVASREFTYLRDSKARVETVLGDARLSLEREPPQQFDILALDAFSGDSIPVHLLSQEAMQLYVRHMKPDGILAVHITNSYLDLSPIVDLAARSLSKEAWQIESDEDPARNTLLAVWVLVSSPGALAGKSALLDSASRLDTPAGLRMWTDAYSNLFQVLK